MTQNPRCSNARSRRSGSTFIEENGRPNPKDVEDTQDVREELAHLVATSVKTEASTIKLWNNRNGVGEMVFIYAPENEDPGPAWKLIRVPCFGELPEASHESKQVDCTIAEYYLRCRRGRCGSWPRTASPTGTRCWPSPTPPRRRKTRTSRGGAAAFLDVCERSWCLENRQLERTLQAEKNKRRRKPKAKPAAKPAAPKAKKTVKKNKKSTK